jgi:hypothetical protein
VSLNPPTHLDRQAQASVALRDQRGERQHRPTWAQEAADGRRMPVIVQAGE